MAANKSDRRGSLKLLLDEMLQPVIAAELRARGHDAEAVAARPDLVTRDDGVIFEAAQAERRALVTENIGDYRVLGMNALAQGIVHGGLIFTTNRGFPRGSASHIGRMVTALDLLLTADRPIEGRELWLRLPGE